MNETVQLALDAAVLVVVLAGIWRFRRPKAALSGNLMVTLALLIALTTELINHPPRALLIAPLAFLIGSLSGWTCAMRVTMTRIPALVGLQNGAGGLASCVVSLVALTQMPQRLAGVSLSAALFGVAVGATALSGSLVASGKLAGWLRQSPMAWTGHTALLSIVLAAVVTLAVAVAASADAARWVFAVGLTLASLCVGTLVAMRVGGADMPVLISLLNALSGFSAGLVGVVVESRILTACGATVAASGLLLTMAMCRAMNRSLWAVLLGSKFDLPRQPSADSETPSQDLPAPETNEVRPRDEASARSHHDSPISLDAENLSQNSHAVTHDQAGGDTNDLVSRAVALLRDARDVIFIPGYGMALAQAQLATVQLASRCQELGKGVKFAVHPLAGRMPGHMHVLLAEAEVDPDALYDLDEVNDAFATTDLAVVVGACDVVNPAAVSVPGTPISGMPILAAHDARHVLVCNLDANPGYSGVDNPLYQHPKTLLLLGDAAESITRLLEAMKSERADG